tara:strand:- start:13 stop:207 length:195 start_codon:yes stop_codon:yes gene_type:complete
MLTITLCGSGASSGIRTHEAIARDLKSRPFDRSGIDAKVLPGGLEPPTFALLKSINFCRIRTTL